MLVKSELHLSWVLFIWCTVFLGISCQIEKPSKTTDEFKINNLEIKDSAMRKITESKREIISPVNVIAFNGVKRNTYDVLFRPFLGNAVSAGLIASDAETLILDSIPNGDSFKVGDEVWILNLGKKIMFDKLPIIQVPESRKNKIAKIHLRKGHYRFNGGDVALEITLENQLPDGLGWYLMADGKLESQIWNINKEVEKLKKKCGPEIESIDFSRARPITDLNKDGVPEFYFPFEDSNEGNLISVCNDEPQIVIEFSSGR